MRWWMSIQTLYPCFTQAETVQEALAAFKSDPELVAVGNDGGQATFGAVPCSQSMERYWNADPPANCVARVVGGWIGEYKWQEFGVEKVSHFFVPVPGVEHGRIVERKLVLPASGIPHAQGAQHG